MSVDDCVWALLSLCAGHRNVYVAVHVPKSSTKHRHKNRRKHHRHHVDRNHSNDDSTDYYNNIQTHRSHDDAASYHGEEIVTENQPSQYTPQDSVGFVPHKRLQSSVSDVTPSSSRRSSLNGHPRYHKSHSLPQKAGDMSIPEIVRGKCQQLRSNWFESKVNLHSKFAYLSYNENMISERLSYCNFR